MEINHTLIPSKNKIEAAMFFAEIMGLEVGEIGHFARMHYAFRVTEEEFGDIFGRVEAKGLRYGSGPGPATLYDMQIGYRPGGRCVYWDDLNGHSMELMTHP
jgi:hypothetical protein